MAKDIPSICSVLPLNKWYRNLIAKFCVLNNSIISVFCQKSPAGILDATIITVLVSFNKGVGGAFSMFNDKGYGVANIF